MCWRHISEALESALMDAVIGAADAVREPRQPLAGRKRPAIGETEKAPTAKGRGKCQGLTQPGGMTAQGVMQTGRDGDLSLIASLLTANREIITVQACPPQSRPSSAVVISLSVLIRQSHLLLATADGGGDIDRDDIAGSVVWLDGSLGYLCAPLTFSKDGAGDCFGDVAFGSSVKIGAGIIEFVELYGGGLPHVPGDVLGHSHFTSAQVSVTANTGRNAINSVVI